MMCVLVGRKKLTAEVSWTKPYPTRRNIAGSPTWCCGGVTISTEYGHRWP